MRVDAHQHFWNFDAARDSWIDESMTAIQKDFTPAALLPLLHENSFDGCVAVEAHQSEEQTHFLIDLATQHSFIKAVVGYVDLQAANIEERLKHYSNFSIVKGFRHALQGEAQRNLMLTPNFIRGIAALQQHNFTYDLLILPDQLGYSTALARQFPNQKFVVDHLAKPGISKKEIDAWMTEIKQIAELPNVYCKLSGMVTEANWKNWEQKDFTPYMDAIVEGFGLDRIMFGSDWPVCLLAASYQQVVNIVKDYFSSFSASEKDKIFGRTACSFYNI